MTMFVKAVFAGDTGVFHVDQTTFGVAVAGSKVLEVSAQQLVAYGALAGAVLMVVGVLLMIGLVARNGGHL